jgi:hypothetical protein
MSLVLLGSTSGSVTLQEPAVAGSTVIDLPATSGTMALTSGSTAFTNLTVTNGASIQGLTVGRGAGAVSTNTAVGASALASNSTGSGVTAVGQAALTASTGNNNTAIGKSALTANTSGADNSAGGKDSLGSNTTGSNNTAFGSNALVSNTTASNNTAVGYQAGYTNTTYSYNTYLGFQAGYFANGGTYNCFVGLGAGYFVTTGAKNTILGAYNGNQGGLDIRTASNYIVLSDGDGNPRAYSDNVGTWTLGGSTNGKLNASANNTLNVSFAGNAYNGMGLDDNSTTSGCRFIGFSLGSGTTFIGSIARVAATSAVVYNTTSDERLKTNIVDASPVLDKLMTVKVRQYDWIEGDLHQDYGFIAQELEPVLSGVVTKGRTEEDVWQLDYSRITPHLVKAIQELKAEFDAYKASHP